MNNKRDKCIDKLLCYMKQEAENKGCSINCIWFDFEQNKPEDVLYNNCIPQNNSEEYKTILKICKVTPTELEEVLNYCITNQYISCHNFKHIQLTDMGYARARSVECRTFKLPNWLCKVLETIVAPSIVAIISSIISLRLIWYRNYSTCLAIKISLILVCKH